MAEIMVETFEQETEHHPEAVEAAKELIESLELEGQMSTTTDTVRLPYRQWTATEKLVYEALCPSHDTVQTYCADTIPLRVLQVLAHAKSTGLYAGFYVLHNSNPAVKDPVLVAYKEGEAYRSDRWHLLARWGAELDSLPTLVDKAAVVIRNRAIAGARKALAELQGKLAALESTPATADDINLTAPYLSWNV